MDSDILDFITSVTQCTYAALPYVGDSLVNVCFDVQELKYAPQFYWIRKFSTMFITQKSLIPTVKKINEVQSLPVYVKTYFNIIRPSVPMILSDLFPSCFLTKRSKSF